MFDDGLGAGRDDEMDLMLRPLVQNLQKASPDGDSRGARNGYDDLHGPLQLQKHKGTTLPE
jgi:hypothetical protein